MMGFFFKRSFPDKHFDVALENYFFFKQCIGYFFEFFVFFYEKVFSPFEGSWNYFSDLFINNFCCFFAVRLGKAVFLFRVVKRNMSDFFIHSINGNHIVGKFRNSFEVVLRTRRNFIEFQVFSSASSQRHGHIVQNLFSGVKILFFGEILSITQCGITAGDNGNLQERGCIFEKPANDGMPGFMISHNFFLIRGNDFCFLFQSTNHPVDSILKIIHIDNFFILSGSNQGCFVADIGNFGTGKSGCLFGQAFRADVSR